MRGKRAQHKTYGKARKEKRKKRHTGSVPIDSVGRGESWGATVKPEKRNVRGDGWLVGWADGPEEKGSKRGRGGPTKIPGTYTRRAGAKSGSTSRADRPLSRYIIQHSLHAKKQHIHIHITSHHITSYILLYDPHIHTTCFRATTTQHRTSLTNARHAYTRPRRTSASSCSLDARSLVTRPGAVRTKPSPALGALWTDHPDPTVIARLGSLSPFFLNWLNVVPCVVFFFWTSYWARVFGRVSLGFCLSGTGQAVLCACAPMCPFSLASAALTG